MFSLTKMRSRHRMSSAIVISRLTMGPSRSEQEMGMSLEGKRVVVLGGTSGNGLATAKAAQREGAMVVVASSRRQRVDSALASLETGAEGHVADLSDEGQVRKFFAHVGAFDHLVYTAGESLQLEPLDAMQFDRARGFVNIRFWGAFMAVKYCSPHIRPGGSITLTNGVAGLRPQKGWTLVASICGAMEALTRALAVELAPIRVNAVCPGVVRTELWSDMAESDRDTLYRNVAQRLLVGRVGEPEDIAQAYLYLMREGYSTGQVIVVDGGATLV
jgi:NAD(P)-dependent dehydrogenase (short-subunit alcohol dehydrogenase family)